MYDAILFDLDGTLLDTERLFLHSARTVLAEEGITEGVDAFLHSTVGVDTPRTVQMFKDRFPVLDVADIRTRTETLFLSLLDKDIPLKPGARELLTALHGQVPLALVTSSFRAQAQKKLKLTQLDAMFQSVVVREDVTHPKPAGEPYLLAASQLGVEPSRCLVFEDSEPGVAAAHAAGMTVVQVPDIVPAQGKLANHIAVDLRSGAAWAKLAAFVD